MWTLETQWYELVFRAFCVFSFLFIVFRLWGKKHFGELTPFDFVLIIIISEGVQNALVKDDKSVSAGLITVVTLVCLNVFLDKVSYFSRKTEKLIDGSPEVLVKDGKIDHRKMRKETITMSELREVMRENGVLDLNEVLQATLETDGHISVVKKSDVSQ